MELRPVVFGTWGSLRGFGEISVRCDDKIAHLGSYWAAVSIDFAEQRLVLRRRGLHAYVSDVGFVVSQRDTRMAIRSKVLQEMASGFGAPAFGSRLVAAQIDEMVVVLERDGSPKSREESVSESLRVLEGQCL